MKNRIDYIVSISIALAWVLLLGHFALENASFELEELKQLYFGDATNFGIDISKKIKFFYISIGFSLIFIILVSWVLRKSVLVTMQNTSSKWFLALIAFGSIVFSVCSFTNLPTFNGAMVCGLVLLIELLFIRFKKDLTKQTIDLESNVSKFLLSLCLTFFINFLTNDIAFLDDWYPYIFALSYVLICFTFRIKFIKLLYFVPIAVFFASETALFVKFKFDFVLHPILFFLFYWIVLSLIVLKLQSKALFVKYKDYLVVASILFGTFIFAHYYPFFNLDTDLFESANPMNAQMLLFEHEQIPMLDFMSSHMYSEQFYGNIYHLLFGYDNSGAFYAYEFLYLFLVSFCAFILLYQLFRKRNLALFIILLVPFSEYIFNPHLMFGVLTFVLGIKVAKSGLTKHYLLLFATIVFLIFWRLDIGVSNLFACIVFLPVLFWFNSNYFNLKNFLKAFLIFAVGILALLVVFILIRDFNYVMDSLKSALHYIAASQTHAFAQLTTVSNQHFYIFYLIYPIISVICLITIPILIKKEENSSANKWLWASGFFFLIYLFNFQRGIVRHHFIEQNDLTVLGSFYLALILFILALMKNKKDWRALVFVLLAFLFPYFGSYFTVKMKANLLSLSVEGKSMNNFNKEIRSEKRRVKNVSFPQSTNQIVQFLNDNLTENETFIDFSNTPSLYYLTNRKVPAYFCQNLQNTVDDYLQLKHIERIEAKSCPIVIFKHSKESWWDATDGVNNTLRQYILAEYIFKNYHPIEEKDGLIVFGRKDKFSINQTLQTKLKKLKVDNYGQSASFVKAYLEEKEIPLEVLKSSENAFQMKFNKEIIKENHLFLEIEFDSIPKTNNAQVFLKSDEETMIVYNFKTLKGKKNYTFRLANHYVWNTREINNIEIISELTPSKIAIIKDNRFED